jgi:small-conductance mechanosensitive channel
MKDALIMVIAVCWLMAGVGSAALVAPALEYSGEWSTLAAWERWTLSVLVVLVWPVFLCALGYGVVWSVGAGLIRLRRKRRVAERERAEAMQHRDAARLDALDNE